MKYLALITLSCLIASISSAPTQISDNNVGDIVNVGVRADVNVSSQVDVTLINIMAKLLSQNLAVIIPPRNPPIDPTESPIETTVAPNPQPEIPNIPKITPEMIDQFRGLLSKSV
ncbi:unnamed protein product [Chironomus riparius]|uniref:Uncharacterized protein n=1 Tax=Chironomus riparius TaxID=315576 RepID=A0A9N9WQC4_9DIPT|nr:unnamed protein product [Chironomus riparius]